MNKMTLSTVFVLILCFFAGESHAQDGYTYTLADNGSYNYTIEAAPNTSTNNFATSVQSYGFTIILPDGVTATIVSSLGGSAGASFFDGSQVGDASIDGYLITETLGSPISLLAPSASTNSSMVTIQLNSMPTTGSISILANDSPLANTIPPLKCFMSADMVDDGMALFPPVVDSVGSGVSGTSSIMFSTLSIPSAELVDVSLYPNPVKDIVTIKGVNDLQSVKIYNINGQQVLSIESNLERLDLSRLQSGVYFAKLEAESGEKTVKLIKE